MDAAPTLAGAATVAGARQTKSEAVKPVVP